MSATMQWLLSGSSKNGFIRKRRPDMFETRLWKEKDKKKIAFNTEEITLTGIVDH